MWNQQEVRGNFSCDLWNVTLWLNYASSRNVVHDECHQSVINLNSNFMSLGNAILTRHKVKQWMGTLTKRRKTTTKVCYDPPKSFTLRPASFFHHQSKLKFVTRSRESRTCFWVEERLEVKGETHRKGKNNPAKENWKVSSSETADESEFTRRKKLFVRIFGSWHRQ